MGADRVAVGAGIDGRDDRAALARRSARPSAAGSAPGRASPDARSAGYGRSLPPKAPSACPLPPPLIEFFGGSRETLRQREAGG